MASPLAVIIGDVHFSLQNLELASVSLDMAISHASRLNIPLIINGDLTNDKAIIRGEVANKIIELLESAQNQQVRVIITVGNHDRINERSLDHSLNFLRPYAEVVETPIYDSHTGIYFIPYQAEVDEFKKFVLSSPAKRLTVVHQGIQGAYLGDYYKDDSSIEPEALAGRRIIANHFHRKQNISLPGGGMWSYVGSPYTVTGGEANDGPKGFCVLYADGSLEQIPTDLRKHVTVERDLTDYLRSIEGLKPIDLLWLKISGPYTELEQISKKDIGHVHLGHSNFKLEKIYTDGPKLYAEVVQSNAQIVQLSDAEILDDLITNTTESPSTKGQLKDLWRELTR